MNPTVPPKLHIDVEHGDLEKELLATPSLASPAQAHPECAPSGFKDVLTRVTSIKSCHESTPPPDGGAMAWLQTAMGHLVVFNSWGFFTSFGVFQTYYVKTLGRSPSDISWIGSIQVFLVFFVGTFSGRACDGGYFRHVFVAGSICLVFGAFMTSISTTYLQVFLAQGVCCGIGNGLLFCPTVAVVSTYFHKHRSVALAIVASGSASGGLIFPVVVQQCLPRIGFAWTVRIIAFIMLINLCFANVFLRTRIAPRGQAPIIDYAAFREAPYVLFSVGMFLVFLGLIFAFYYVGSFGRDVVGLEMKDSINLLLLMNGIGIPGRIIPGYIADRRTGPLNILVPYIIVASAILYCWTSVRTHAGLEAFAVIYGFFAAGIQSLFPATLSSLTADLQKVGVRMGMVFTIISFASLAGPPIAGALIQHANGNYLYAQIFAGSVMLCGGGIVGTARFAKAGRTLRIRV